MKKPQTPLAQNYIEILAKSERLIAVMETSAGPSARGEYLHWDKLRQRLGLTTLKYQELDDLVGAIGLPKKNLCTYCWDGCEGRK